MNQYILAVPNFSDGRRREVIETVTDQVRNVKGVKLLGYHPDPDFNRTVVTVIGKPDELKEALLNMAAKSIELIDMEQQTGSHPRIGAQDTIPIFPLRGISLGECIELAEEIGNQVYQRFGVPVYFSGENSRKPERRSLDFIRKGQYEGLKKVAHTEERRPDLGPAGLHPTAGAVIVSSGTNPLVAYNVILGTDNLAIAKRIARIVRGPSGGFTTVRSIGLRFEERKQVCVSMNMFDFEKTPIYRTHELIKLEASRYGIPVVGSEIVGVVSLESLVNSLEFYLGLENFDRNQILENHLLELEPGENGQTVVQASFLDRLAAGSPAPGGGSAAAHTAAVACALVAMVARLTTGKEKYADVEGRMLEIVSLAERLRAWFEDAVVLDEQAFMELMAARRLPRTSEAELTARQQAIEKATQQAACVPLEVAHRSLQVLQLSLEVVEKGNPNAITDAAASGLMAHSAISAAGLNVKTNAASATDREAAQEWEWALVSDQAEAEEVIHQLRETFAARAGYVIS